jgi:8-oxo-dGTP diphosphatase
MWPWRLNVNNFMRKTTLCLPIKNGSVLLAMKKLGLGVGKWNGTGGKVEPGEKVKAAAVREMREEIGITAKIKDLKYSGYINFHWVDKPEWSQQMHIFLVNDWEGKHMESEEMKPRRFNLKRIPYKKMWSSDTIWFPLVLAGKKIKADFYYHSDTNNFSDYKIKEV